MKIDFSNLFNSRMFITMNVINTISAQPKEEKLAGKYYIRKWTLNSSAKGVTSMLEKPYVPTTYTSIDPSQVITIKSKIE